MHIWRSDPCQLVSICCVQSDLSAVSDRHRGQNEMYGLVQAQSGG